jgi:hypothetical protein
MLVVHYWHYKAAIQDDLSTEILAQQLMVKARSRIPPENWSIGLQVMLEKIAGVRLVEKLQAVQLYEADFNCYNQFIFGRRQCKCSQTAVIFQRNYSANKEAQQRMPNLTKLLWLTFLDRPNVQ